MGKLLNQTYPNYFQLQQKLQGAAPIRWAFIGDGITRDYNEQTSHYINFFKDYLLEEPLEGVSRCDDTFYVESIYSIDATEDIYGLEMFLESEKIDIVVLMLGWQAREHISNQVFGESLRRLLRRIHNQGAIPILQTPYCIALEDGRYELLKETAQVIRRVAAEQQAILIDHDRMWSNMMYSGIDVVREYLVDTAYPNEDGHITMAQTLCTALDIWKETSSLCKVQTGKGHALCK
jgi:hypothetical protein